MYNLPESTIVNCLITKKTFIDQLGADNRMKDHFTNDIAKVEWLAKLAPSTLNVADGKDVHEIAVFRVPVKENDCPNDVFAFIDSLMPRHTVFILCRTQGLERVLAFPQACIHLNYKVRIAGNINTNKTFNITKTYRSQWIDEKDLNLMIEGLDMDAIYEKLVRQVAGNQIIMQSDNLRDDVEKSTERETLLRQLEALKKKETNEKQPKKKFELHKMIVELNKKLL